jgi:hypothetical protein
MHHMDPAASGHLSSSGGLLPAFNGNTKPLKYQDLDEAFVAWNSMQGCATQAVEAGGKDRRINE